MTRLEAENDGAALALLERSPGQTGLPGVPASTRPLFRGACQGRPPEELVVEAVEQLEVEDFLEDKEDNAPEPHAGQHGLKRIRAIHHKVAQYLVEGMRPGEVARRVGMSPSRISTLQNVPAFKELMDHYNNVEGSVEHQFQERMEMIAFLAHEELLERLMDAPEKIKDKDLLAMVNTGATQSGIGAKTVVEHRHFAISAEEAEAIKNASQAQEGRIIDVTDYQRSDMGGASEGASQSHHGDASRGKANQGAESRLLFRAEGGEAAEELDNEGPAGGPSLPSSVD